MSAEAEGGEGPTPIDDRTRRALTRDMVVSPDDPGTADWEVAVYHGSTRHVVDTSVPVCDCEDMMYRRPEGGCFHVRRWELTTGERAIPAWANREAVDQVLLQQREYLAEEGTEVGP